ncbi:MAG: phosphoribosylglycinamide formyltransferase [Gemmatimonadetes bacterium]|nr:phosphoribosylglycinamide formyltransferase [Gemmatimonadota bacterium]
MSARIAVLASGGGTNLQTLLDYFNGGKGPEGVQDAARVALVVSDRADAGALERARRTGVPERVIPVGGRAEDDVVHDTIEAFQAAGVELVALAGYLRRIPAAVVARYRGRVVNVHPALLPAFGGQGMYGLRVHAAVLAAGCTVSGASVHMVDEQYDTGPILLQWPVPVLASDAPETLAARVLEVEHRIYAPAVEALARALARGEPVPSLRLREPAGFRLARWEPPAVSDVRKTLGIS